MKTAVAFGTFDLFHDGHKYFLSHILRSDEYLIIFILGTEVAEANKGIKLHDNLCTRITNVRKFLSKTKYNYYLYAHLSLYQQQNLQQTVDLEPDIIYLGEEQVNNWTAALISQCPKARVKYINRIPGISSTLLRSQLKDATDDRGATLHDGSAWANNLFLSVSTDNQDTPLL